MQLNIRARENYRLEITTDPAVTAWEASFDGGTTWVDGTPNGSVFEWLVAGPDFNPAGETAATFTTLAANVAPLIRAHDNPEVIVRGAPLIYLTR